MYLRVLCRSRSCVALLAEGVDRNTIQTVSYGDLKPSPSSRRAWIEMQTVYFAQSSS